MSTLYQIEMRTIRSLISKVNDIWRLLFPMREKTTLTGDEYVIIQNVDDGGVFSKAKVNLIGGGGTGDVSWTTLSGKQPVVIGNESDGISSSSRIFENPTYGGISLESTGGATSGIFISNDGGTTYAGGIYAYGSNNDLTIYATDDLTYTAKRIVFGSAAYNSFMNVYDNSSTNWDSSFTVYKSGFGNTPTFNVLKGGDIYMPLLSSDDTEDHVLAIDDSTGLLSKRSVASLSSTPDILFLKVEVSSAELLNIFSSPKVIVPAPGPGKVILIENGICYYHFNTVDYLKLLNLTYSNFDYGQYACNLNHDFLDVSIAQIEQGDGTTIKMVEDSPIYLTSSSDPVAGDGTVTIYIWYREVTL